MAKLIRLLEDGEIVPSQQQMDILSRMNGNCEVFSWREYEFKRIVKFYLDNYTEAWVQGDIRQLAETPDENDEVIMARFKSQYL